MKTAASHIARFPNCRSQTLAHLIAKEKTTAALMAHVERQVDKQIAAAFRTFHVNCRRALRKAGA